MNTFELLGYLSSTPDYSQYIPGALKAPQSDRLAQSCNSEKHVWDESQFPWYVYVPAHLYSFWDSKLYSLDFSVILSTKRNYVYSIIIKIHRKIVIYFHYFSLFISFFFTWSMIGPIFGPVSMKLLQLLFIVEGMGNFVVNQRFVPSTLISLINVEARLLILKKKSTLHAHFHPPRLLIS